MSRDGFLKKPAPILSRAEPPSRPYPYLGPPISRSARPYLSLRLRSLCSPLSFFFASSIALSPRRHSTGRRSGARWRATALGGSKAVTAGGSGDDASSARSRGRRRTRGGPVRRSAWGASAESTEGGGRPGVALEAATTWRRSGEARRADQTPRIR